MAKTNNGGSMEYVSRSYDLGPPFFMDLDHSSYLLGHFHVETLGFWSERDMVYGKSLVRLRLAKLMKVVK